MTPEGNTGSEPAAGPTDQEILRNQQILRAQCEEKECKYLTARDLYIQLNMPDDALRCSGILRFQYWRKENNPYIRKLAVIAGILIITFVVLLIYLNEKQRNLEIPSATWQNTGDIKLSGYPSWFLYDKKEKKIKTQALISEEMKAELINAFPANADSTYQNEYQLAVDKLAYNSTGMKGSYYWLLLLVSGLASVVGVLIREILDLIRHYCYEKDLDFKTWWPWYVLRPIVGFMIGILVILFSGTEVLFSIQENSSETYLIAIAIIAGISMEDVMFKLRKISQVMFGNNSRDEEPVAERQNPEVNETAPAGDSNGKEQPGAKDPNSGKEGVS